MGVASLILLCFFPPSFEGGEHLADQLYSAKEGVLALPKDLTIENIDCVLEQINVLQNNKNPTEEDGAIAELNIGSMFLKTLRDYMENPNDKDLAASLRGWAERKLGFCYFLWQAIERNPENEALKNINLNFPAW